MQHQIKCFLVWIIAFLVTCDSAFAQRRPNIVLIVTDDQGYADVGFHGSKDIKTPQLDALAAGGVICTQGYVTFPVCSPSRAGFLAGRHGARFGYNTNPDLRTSLPEITGLPMSERLLPEALKPYGYATGIIGKWHLGVHPQFHPLNRGFDEFFGFLGGGHKFWGWTPDDGKSASYSAPLMRGREVVPDTQKRYLTDVLSDEACAFIHRHQAEPFFLYIAYNAPHEPCEASPDYLARVPHLEGKRQQYAAMILAVDDGIGRLRQTIRDAGLEDDTLFIFITDNGGPENANTSINDPLRGQKSQLWEGGIRVPYVMSWKGKLPAGTKYDKPVSTLDFLPTALAAAGADLEAMPSIEGVNLVPYLIGSTTADPHESLFWRHNTGGWAVRQGEWKLVSDPEGRRHLFNIDQDISEADNLIDAEPEIARRLANSWAQWNASNASYIPWNRQQPRPATVPATQPETTKPAGQ